MVIYKILRGVKLFELGCIYTGMLHILQWLSWSKPHPNNLLSTPLFDIHLADIFDISQNLICTFIVVNTAPSLIISTVYKVIGTYHIEPWDEQIALERLVYKNSGLNTGTYVNKQSGKWQSFIWS